MPSLVKQIGKVTIFPETWVTTDKAIINTIAVGTTTVSTIRITDSTTAKTATRRLGTTIQTCPVTSLMSESKLETLHLDGVKAAVIVGSIETIALTGITAGTTVGTTTGIEAPTENLTMRLMTFMTRSTDGTCGTSVASSQAEDRC